MRNFLLLVLAISISGCGISASLKHLPNIAAMDTVLAKVVRLSPTSFASGNSFLQQNEQKLWELYVAGDPFEIGATTGALEDSLFKRQEKIFFSKVEQLVPSERKQKWLRKLLAFYNRKLYKNISNEYQSEIYGLSKYALHDFDFIAPPFRRTLYLHAAHDIGHALQDLALVGCTSFAAWNEHTPDGKLLIGRNLDFFAGDDFAENKVVAFIKPEKGIPFMMVTWPGMLGAVSGMNNQGLTVTINAAKSKIPLVAKTPISFLTREILQYAKNIDEAIAIARSRQVFVSESIMVGSANDNKAILIEVSPKEMDVYDVENGMLLCSNHFQGSAFKNDNRNKYQIANSHSDYRYKRLKELTTEANKITPTEAVNILRDRNGIDGKMIGFGNEKAINQLLAHHGVVFKPSEKLVWISANPYQLGEFVCYDLNNVFSGKIDKNNLGVSKFNIPADPFLLTEDYRNYERFRILDKKMDEYILSALPMPKDFITEYISSNSDFWVVYGKLGEYYFNKNEWAIAKPIIEKALSKEITTFPAREKLTKMLAKCNRKTR